MGVYSLGTRAYISHTPHKTAFFYLCFSFKMLSYSGIACRYVQKLDWDRDCIDWAHRMHRRHTVLVQGCGMKIMKVSVMKLITIHQSG